MQGTITKIGSLADLVKRVRDTFDNSDFQVTENLLVHEEKLGDLYFFMRLLREKGNSDSVNAFFYNTNRSFLNSVGCDGRTFAGNLLSEEHLKNYPSGLVSIHIQQSENHQVVLLTSKKKWERDHKTIICLLMNHGLLKWMDTNKPIPEQYQLIYSGYCPAEIVVRAPLLDAKGIEREIRQFEFTNLKELSSNRTQRYA